MAGDESRWESTWRKGRGNDTVRREDEERQAAERARTSHLPRTLDSHD